MEEIDITQLLNYFKSKWIYILFAMSVAFCLSSIYINRFRVPEYTSSTTILLSQSQDSSTININDLNVNKSLIGTYREIIKSKRVLRQVIENLDLDYKYETLVNMIGVSEITDTSLIKISVTSTDNEEAATIANMAAEVFKKEIDAIYNLENISTIDEAEVSQTMSSTSTTKIVGIATLAGAFLSIAIIFVTFYFDTTLKNEEDVENATGLPVIGIVPVSREKIKKSAHRKYYDNLAKKNHNSEILPVKTVVRKIEVDAPHDSEKEIGTTTSMMPVVDEMEAPKRKSRSESSNDDEIKKRKSSK